MFTINLESEAGQYLRSCLENPSTYKVSVEPRKDGVAIKRNEGMWTPTLSVEGE